MIDEIFQTAKSSYKINEISRTAIFIGKQRSSANRFDNINLNLSTSQVPLSSPKYSSFLYLYVQYTGSDRSRYSVSLAHSETRIRRHKETLVAKTLETILARRMLFVPEATV